MTHMIQTSVTVESVEKFDAPAMFAIGVFVRYDNENTVSLCYPAIVEEQVKALLEKK